MKKHFLILSAVILLTAFTGFSCANVTSPNGFTSRNLGVKAENESATDSDAFTFEEKDGDIVITGLKYTTENEIVIPSAINGLPVREIKEYAFKNCEITSLTVPKSVEKIGYGVLSECAALSRLTLPFTGERHLTEWSANDYNFGYIFGSYAFVGGEKTMQFYHKTYSDEVELVDYYIPTALKEVKITGINNTLIPYSAFYNCSGLEKITLGKDVLSIGEFAFSGVNADILFEEPKIEIVGEHAFEDYKGVSLAIPTSVKEIKKKGYSACVNVKSFDIPDSVEKIDIYAFSYCYDLESVKISKNIRKLSAETFYFCISLKSVVLPENLILIDEGAFDCCKALQEINLPPNLSRINANAFKSCEKLKAVRFEDANGWRYYSILTSGEGFSFYDISVPATAARYLTDTFKDFIWEKAS